MRYVNPNALFLIAFAACVGAIAGSVLIGATIGLAIVLYATFWG